MSDFIAPEYDSVRRDLKTIEDIEASTLRPLAPKQISGIYRRAELPVPEVIDRCAGISIFGRTLKSWIFSTDIVVIRNCDADAVLSVYPVTCQPIITKALIATSERPVFTGVSGGKTTGTRSVELALEADMQGAAGVVVNSPTPVAVISSISRLIDIPVIATVTDFDDIVLEKIEAGARIINVAAGVRTADVVRELRAVLPDVPIIASGGKTDESILTTIEAGADAISWTPPNIQEIQHIVMERYRSM